VYRRRSCQPWRLSSQLRDDILHIRHSSVYDVRPVQCHHCASHDLSRPVSPQSCSPVLVSLVQWRINAYVTSFRRAGCVDVKYYLVSSLWNWRRQLAQIMTINTRVPEKSHVVFIFAITPTFLRRTRNEHCLPLSNTYAGSYLQEIIININVGYLPLQNINLILFTLTV